MNNLPDEHLLQRFLNNNCTPEEAKAVLDWLETREGRENLKKSLDLDISMVERIKLETLSQVQSDTIFEKIKGNTIRSKRNRSKQVIFSPHWWKVAAAVLLPLVAVNLLLWLVLSNPSEEIVWNEVYVPKGERLQVLLQDGSKVWLNADTKLQYPNTFNNDTRRVVLDGEAYFSVKTDPSTPFVVDLTNSIIRVTGTEFNVRAYDEENNVTTFLHEGNISFIQGTKEYELVPGQQLEFVKNKGSVHINSGDGQLSAWRMNKIVFKDTPLAEVVRVLERWYNVKFSIKDNDILRYTYTISFDNEPLDNILNGLEKITPVKFKAIDDTIEITKRSK